MTDPHHRRPPRDIRDALTVQEAADTLGLSPNALKAWHDVPFYRVGPRGDRRYLKAVLDLIRRPGRFGDHCPTCGQAWPAYTDGGPAGRSQGTTGRAR